MDELFASLIDTLSQSGWVFAYWLQLPSVQARNFSMSSAGGHGTVSLMKEWLPHFSLSIIKLVGSVFFCSRSVIRDRSTNVGFQARIGCTCFALQMSVDREEAVLQLARDG